jgi:hypothetical protein
VSATRSLIPASRRLLVTVQAYGPWRSTSSKSPTSQYSILPASALSSRYVLNLCFVTSTSCLCFSSIAQRMSLNSCTEVGELSLEALMFSCKRIRVLDLSKTALADRVLRALALNCPLVNALYLCDCKAVTDLGVSALAGCQRLGVLRINGCTVRWHVLNSLNHTHASICVQSSHSCPVVNCLLELLASLFRRRSRMLHLSPSGTSQRCQSLTSVAVLRSLTMAARSSLPKSTAATNCAN